MSRFAFVDGKRVRPTRRGQRGRCKYCEGEMFAKLGTKISSHWCHLLGCPNHAGGGDMGAWHLGAQDICEEFGAHTEVEFPNGHEADAQFPDGRIIEFQTAYLNPDDVESRETTYDRMCWVYDASNSWVIPHARSSPAFDWGRPDRRFFAHTKPVYLDCMDDGIWRVISINTYKIGRKRVYDGLREFSCATLREFIQQVSAGERFGNPPKLIGLDPRESRPTYARTNPDDDDKPCSYVEFTFIYESGVHMAQAESATA